mmetsp:Transcript_7798/g.20759  ORF Transcript_7798/g.20759 Transcript_7798/m.20759 type:complete len:136 (-) Transcript_7798:1625-2032(-)
MALPRWSRLWEGCETSCNRSHSSSSKRGANLQPPLPPRSNPLMELPLHSFLAGIPLNRHSTSSRLVTCIVIMTHIKIHSNNSHTNNTHPSLINGQYSTTLASLYQRFNTAQPSLVHGRSNNSQTHLHPHSKDTQP